MSSAAEIDWDRVELDYVLGGDEVTFEWLAQEHGVPEKGIRERSSADNWPAKRAAHRSAVLGRWRLVHMVRGSAAIRCSRGTVRGRIWVLLDLWLLPLIP